jgi:AraC-like DNA-binding protein
MPWSKVVTFYDPALCEAALQSTVEAEILPAARGRFHVNATQVGMKKLRMQRFEVSLPQIGTFTVAPDRKSIGFLIEANSSGFQHCGLEVTPNDILVYGYEVVHQRSPFDFRYGTMSVPMKDFPILCRTLIGSELEKPLAWVRPDPALMARLRTLHKIAGQLAHDTPDLLEQTEVGRALEEQLTHLMVRCLAEGASVDTRMIGRQHDAIIARFEEFLAANPDRPLYLTAICAAIGVPERTLRAACEDHLGMGPIRFLTLRRMHLARRALVSADPLKSTVTRVVTDHGFWELGRFSVAYRNLFGESPSETLRRPAEQLPTNFNRPSSLLGSRGSQALAAQ